MLETPLRVEQLLSSPAVEKYSNIPLTYANMNYICRRKSDFLNYNPLL